MPEVSIVMPVRNVGLTVDTAVRSIITQSFEDWELIVVDDGSTDHTVARLVAWADSDPRIGVHVNGQGAGLSARLNQAIELSAGPLIARMDGDDVSYPHRLATQVAYMHDHPSVDVVAAGMMVFSSDGTPRGRRCPRELEHEAITANVFGGIPLSHPTWLGRRQWFMAQRYNAWACGWEDMELLLRAHGSSRYANIPDLLLGYREDRIKLRRSLNARRQMSVSLLQYGLRHGQVLQALSASVGHLLKGARDAAAVALRREDLVLNRRVQLASPSEVDAWSVLWAEVSAA